jgi:hypothetical protein
MFDAPDEELHGLLAVQGVDNAGLDFSAGFMKKTFFHRLFEVHNARGRRVVTRWVSPGSASATRP